MKVIQITDHNGSGGVNSFVYDLCRAQKKLGNEVLFISLIRSETPSKTELEELKSLGIKILCLKAQGKKDAVLHYVGHLKKDQPTLIGVGEISLAGALALGLTGPCLRAAGYPLDIRRTNPYCGYETYDFRVPTYKVSDCYNRLRIRLDEAYESLKIVSQCLDRLDEIAARGEDPSNTTMVADPTIAWPARMSIATDGQGQSLEHVREIMGSSMESLIHHFKLVTEGFHVPAGQVYQTVEHAKGILGVHLVSDGGTRPFRAHFRDPSYANLQALAMMTEGGQLADVVVALAAIDPVLGGVDR